MRKKKKKKIKCGLVISKVKKIVGNYRYVGWVWGGWGITRPRPHPKPAMGFKIISTLVPLTPRDRAERVSAGRMQIIIPNQMMSLVNY